MWMPGSLRELEDAILERRIRFRINPVLISAMMSAVTDEDRWGNHWLAKERAANKIDAAVAICMAIGATMACHNLAEIGRAHVALQSLMRISYAVFCLNKKTQNHRTQH